ncbi:innexin inx2-like [Limulus polyphemus]|uniref:Innexin n=1 Tax=Limulus polyphemus TaxID=6850 RepID=A0ABM1BWG0_LIMPO|nr:innexin inx2-like [Limulus polyphemus]
MVLDLFGALKGALKFATYSIDDSVCRLHYKATVLILTAFSLLVTSTQYFGDPIDCMSTDNIPQNLLDTFCWIHTTFTLPSAMNLKVGVEVAAPGVKKTELGDKKTYHSYYQWVCFVLFLQAGMFYLPRYLWKIWEGSLVKKLVSTLNSPVLSFEAKSEAVSLVVEYLKTHLNNHGRYMGYFVITEIMYFVNVIGQMYLIDKFLGGEFTTYGTDVIQFAKTEQRDRVDPMVRIFPRMTKCTFNQFGSSGDVKEHDVLCMLPLNIINEKIYIFLWFWLVMLCVVSGVKMVYRLVTLVWQNGRYLLLKTRASIASETDIETVCNYCYAGDWFLIYLLCKNMDAVHFKEVMANFARELEDSKEFSRNNVDKGKEYAV